MREHLGRLAGAERFKLRGQGSVAERKDLRGEQAGVARARLADRANAYMRSGVRWAETTFFS